MTTQTIRFGEYEEEYDDFFRPTESNAKHYYNLQNQSWGIPRKNKEGDLSDPVFLYFQELGQYPSNYESVWPGLQYQAVQPTKDPYERVFPSLYQDALGSNVKAAKGYFIIDLLRRGASRQEAYSQNKDKYPILQAPALTTVADITPGGASITTSWAGRIFYAGFDGGVIEGDLRSPNLNNMVLFSVLIQNRKDFFKCYQDGDPTSRESSDLVDTDGGFIKISNAEKIIALAPLKDKLVVIAKNGVWAISGGSDYGFTATNYKVDRISNFSGLAIDSVVEEGGKIFFWGKDGIFVIAKNQLGELEVVNISEPTIQTYYQNIPISSKEQVFGKYDSVEKTVKWVYRIGEAFTDTSETYELIFHTLLNAFTVNRIYPDSLNSKEIYGIISSSEFEVETLEDSVYATEEKVIADTEDVVLNLSGRIDKEQSSRYLVLVKSDNKYYFAFAYYKNTDFKDWGETDAYGYMVTGQNIATDSSVAKQIPYLTMHFIRTEDAIDSDGVPTTPSGCLVRVLWDWATSNKTKKFGSSFQAYRPNATYLSTSDNDPGMLLVSTKSKVRGRGRAFAMKLETEPEKDCRVIGWNINVDGNSYT